MYKSSDSYGSDPYNLNTLLVSTCLSVCLSATTILCKLLAMKSLQPLTTE